MITEPLITKRTKECPMVAQPHRAAQPRPDLAPLPAPHRHPDVALRDSLGAFRGVVFGLLPSLGLWAAIIVLVRRLFGG